MYIYSDYKNYTSTRLWKYWSSCACSFLLNEPPAALEGGGRGWGEGEGKGEGEEEEREDGE